MDVGDGPRDAALDEECVDLLDLRRSGVQARAGARRRRALPPARARRPPG